MLEAEAILWQKIWDRKDVRVETWGKEYALMMPFVLPCPEKMNDLQIQSLSTMLHNEWPKPVIFQGPSMETCWTVHTEWRNKGIVH